MSYTFRKSTLADLPVILNLRDQAREIMRSYGNTFQWPDGYPSDDMFKKDIELGGSHYDGQWLDEEPYHVIHRIASTPSSHGILDALLNYCESQVSNIRIDTHEANIIMRQGLERHGYQYCGIIYLLDGNARLAYQKIITTGRL